MSGHGQLNDLQRRDWLRLSRSENVGPVTFRQLINRFGSAEAALEALPELSNRGGLRRTLKIYSRADAERDLERAAAIKARFIAYGERDYPPLLRQTDTAPPLICALGRSEIAQMKQVAFVGSRNASAVGRKFTRMLVEAIAAAGYGITSGLARGIDTSAHEASLKTGTCAICACGLDIIYPPENKDLYRQISETGLILSEMVPGTQPKAEYFPRRNRIIAGIALGVVVVEAAARSGSLITARLAAEFSRDVFAVPGSPLDARAYGTNKLIQDGAYLVQKPEDVLEVIARTSAHTPPEGFAGDDGEAIDWAVEARESDRETVSGLLSPTPVEVDELARAAKLPVQHVIVILMELELAGRLQRHSGQKVSWRNPET